MGESQSTLFQPEFNRMVRDEARDERLTADAGTILLREFMDRSGLTALLDKHLADARDPDRITHPFIELLRTELLRLAQGYTDQRDVELLRDDPALRLAVSERRGQHALRHSPDGEPDGLCSQPTLSRLAAALGALGNRQGIAAVLRLCAEANMRLLYVPSDLIVPLNASILSRASSSSTSAGDTGLAACSERLGIKTALQSRGRTQ